MQNDGVLAVRLPRGGALGLVMLGACGPDPGPPIPYLAEQVATIEITGEGFAADGELDEAFYASSVGACEATHAPCVEERVDARFVATVSSLRYRTCAKEALPADGYGDACVRTSGSVECVEDAVPE